MISMVKSGIYAIVCVVTNKIYIGSTIDYRNRWNEHRNMLRKNNHHSQKLQRAWNKYGENKFIFSMIEEILDETLLLKKEQYWIDKQDAYYNGYNGRKEASPGDWQRSIKSRKYILRLPNGSESLIVNLTDYCRKNNLNQGALSAVARHITNHHKHILCRFEEETYEQWQEKRRQYLTSRPPKRPPSPYRRNGYIIYAPDGSKFIVPSLTTFCNENNLSQGNMVEVARGHRKQHKGYRCEAILQTRLNKPS
jgi:group I intron endonuclease